MASGASDVGGEKVKQTGGNSTRNNPNASDHHPKSHFSKEDGKKNGRAHGPKPGN